MSRQDNIDWMELYAKCHGATLSLTGECGFGCPCVGIIINDVYPDYEWFDEGYNTISENGDVWTPADAYHKHPCVAVLGRGEDAELQLCEWLKWFNKEGFIIKTGEISRDAPFGQIEIMLNQHKYARMVKI